MPAGNRPHRRRALVLALLRFAVVATLFCVLAAPFVTFLINAFARQWFFPQIIPSTWSLEAWERIFGARSDIPEALLNSTLIALGVTLLSLLIGLPGARALGLYNFRGKRLVQVLIFAPTIVPPLAVGMGLSVNFLRVGLGGTLPGVILVHLVPVMPYVVLTLAGVFANYNPDYEQQAQTLGAKPLAVLRYVTLPAIFPGVVVAGLFAFLISWSQYILTLLIGGGRVMTLPILLFSSAAGGDNAQIAAQSLLLVAPVLLILLLTSRYLAGGAARGFGGV
jgi:putative spermidine/putrescine transport system permease protein